MDRTVTLRATVADETARGLASVNSSVAKSLSSAERRQETLIKNNSASLASEAQKIIRSVNPLATATARYNAQLAKLRSAQRDGAISGREFSDGLAGLNRRLKETEDRARGVQRRSADISGAFRRAAGAVAAVGGGVSVGLIARDAISTASNYEQQLNAVRSVTLATEAEIAKLNETARELGSATAFSATESAQAMELLGQAGFSTNEILSSIGGTLDLAAAGSVDLAVAADISASALRGFNLQASESGRISDVLALTSVKSNATISDLGEALKFAAPTAVAFGISVEETVASVAKLADAGIKGGIGGRGFQAVTTALVKERDKVEALIGDFDVQADGLTSVLRRISEANPTQAQAIDIFKGENFDVFNILKLAAVDAANSTDTLTKSLENAEGAARKIADIRFQGLARLVDEFGGAREDFFIEIGQSGGLDAVGNVIKSITDQLRSPAAKEFAQSIGQGLAGAVKGLQDNWTLVVTATKLATVAALTYAAIQWASVARNIAAVGAAWAIVTNATAAAGTALAFASTGGVVGIARGIAAIAGNFVSLGAAAAAAALAAAPLALTVGAVVAAGAGLVIFRKDIAEALTGTRDVGVALQAVGLTLAQAFAPAKEALANFGAEITSRLEAIGVLDLGAAIADGWRDFSAALAETADSAISLAARGIPAVRGFIAAQKALGEFNTDVRANAITIENDRTRTRIAGSDAAPIGVIAPAFENADAAENAFFRLRDAGERFNVVTDEATKKAVELANAQNILAGAGGNAAAAQEQLTQKIDTQRASLAAQANELRALNDLRASGASADEIAVLEKRQQLQQQFPEFAKANRELFDQEVERLALEERRAATLAETETVRKREAEELSRVQEEAARDLTQRRDQLARGFADVFTDVWRSFRTEGLSAIDVIKDALRNAFDNFIGQTIENAFRPLAEQILTGRTPELNQAGQVFTQAAIDARARGISGPADPFGQSPGVSTRNITARDLQATLNNQTNIFGNLFGSLKKGFDGFISVGTNLGQSLGNLLGGGGNLLGALGGAAAGGFAGFQLGTGAADLFNGRQGETGSKIGGAVGGGIGFAIGGPVGSAIGSAIGSFAGDILGGLFGRKTGSATTNLSTGDVSDVKQSKKDSRNELRDAIAEGAFDAISAVREILDATLDASLGLRVNVGKRSASADLIDSSTGRTLGTAALDRNDIDASIRAALKLVVDRGFEGVDSTLGKVTKALTQTSLPAERLVQTLSTISEALRFGEEEPSVWATAIKDLTAAFGEAIDAAGGLGSAVRDLAEVQVEALQKIADNFDEDVDKQIRTIRAPQEQEALDLLEAQLKRLADAQGINDALARAQAQVAGAPAAGAASGTGRAIGASTSRDDFFRGGIFGAGSALDLAAAAATSAAPAITDAAAAMQTLGLAANDNGDAQTRLARVNELAQAEWEQFIRQAGDTPEALSAVAAALAQIGDRAEDLGLDLASLNVQLAEVKRGLAATFDEEIERQRLAIEQPGQAQALELFEQQAARLDAARAVSDSAADEQARLTRVVALNTAEWRQFIDQAASTPETLADAAAALDAYADRLAAQGVDPSLLRQRVTDARGQLAGTFNTDVAQQLLQLANPTLAEFNALLVEQQQRVETAQSLGANVSGAERLNALERRRFFEGLSDAQKTELGDFLGIIEDFSGRYAFVLSEFLGSTAAARESLEEVAQGYTETADAWKSVTANLRSTLEGIRSEFAPGNLSEQLGASTSRFEDALSRSRDPSLTEEQRRTAAESLGSIGQDTLRIGRDLFGTTAQFGALFDRITTGLEGAITAGDGAETLARAQADAARASADSLAIIERQLQQPDLSLPILEEQRQRLAAIEGVSTRQAELLDELIAIERARAAQQEFAIAGLQAVNAPLLQSTGNPVLDAEAARIVARAVEQSGLNVIQAIGTSTDISEERLRALETTIGEQRDELAELKRLLRNFLDTQAAVQAQQAAA